MNEKNNMSMNYEIEYIYFSKSMNISVWNKQKRISYMTATTLWSCSSIVLILYTSLKKQIHLVTSSSITGALIQNI